MENQYLDLIKQTFDFPTESFTVNDNELYFNEIPLMDVVKQYGTPLKITYLPKIGEQIQKAKKMFNVAMAKVDYRGKYTYCYCTKSSHFSFVLEEVLKNDAHLETSSAYDMYIVKDLIERGFITKDHFIICNGYKRELYTEQIVELVNEGFENLIPVLDNKEELLVYQAQINKKVKIGIRIASEEEPTFDFYTSRLGIRYIDIIDFYNNQIKKHPNLELKMLHFFINTGIKDNIYYWSELAKCLNVYYRLKQICPTLDTLNIGGGLPIRNSLGFEYDYEYMIEQIVQQIKKFCTQKGVPEPNIFTEFGSYTVGESGANIYSVMSQKQQNDREVWYMVDNSFITTLPDTWGINQRFILLAINNWDQEYVRVNLGGLSCDSQDYYNSEAHDNQVFLPRLDKDEPLYIGFFHTGAYQESLSGYGGIKHCLIPSPKHVLIDRDENGEITTKLFAKEQSAKSMLKILGY
ncbi:MAG: arginine decarboxylase [Flavobacteriales bacterium]|nr:arginine decarboxylase [Flavobacteriales bacterium]